MLLALQLGADGPDDVANMELGHHALGLSKGILYTCLESVSPSTGYVIDAEHMEWVEPHSDVKAIFATAFHHGLFGTIMGIRRELLIFI